jgi:DedD protein
MDEALRRRLIGGAVLLIALVTVTGVFFRGGGEALPTEEAATKPDSQSYALEYPENAEILTTAESQPETQIGTIPAAPLEEELPPVEANQKRVRANSENTGSSPTEAKRLPLSPQATSAEEKTRPLPSKADKPVSKNPAAVREADLPGPKAVGAGEWAVQVGSFASRSNAAGIEKKLTGMGYSAFISKTEGQSPALYRVRTGPYATQEEARQDAGKLREQLKQDVKVVAAR